MDAKIIDQESNYSLSLSLVAVKIKQIKIKVILVNYYHIKIVKKVNNSQ